MSSSALLLCSLLGIDHLERDGAIIRKNCTTCQTSGAFFSVFHIFVRTGAFYRTYYPQSEDETCFRRSFGIF